MSSSKGNWGFPPPSGRGGAPLSSPASEAPPDSASGASTKRRPWWVLNLVLFAGTVYSVFEVGQGWSGADNVPGFQGWLAGWPFAVPLLAILLCHELGHYIAARAHRVPASLPYFIPLPKLSPFGTFGAVIIMPRRIRSANALLDIGAAGPLAGIAVAIPTMIIGLMLSKVGPRSTSGYIQEGQSILYWLLKRVVHGPIAPDQDVFVHPTALAAWAGFLVTFLNLLPVGQLDGGHVAYALLGERQNRFARWAALLPLVMIAYNAWVYVRPILTRAPPLGFGAIGETGAEIAQRWLPVSAVTVWVGILILLLLLRRLSGFAHPPVDHPELSPVRRVVAIATLALFVLLFMPTPWAVF